jgi:hypothetical protein
VAGVVLFTGVSSTQSTFMVTAMDDCRGASAGAIEIRLVASHIAAERFTVMPSILREHALGVSRE